jgi:hypothetical protein
LRERLQTAQGRPGTTPWSCIPLEPVLGLLDGPGTVARNKAALIVLGPASGPGGDRLYREVIECARCCALVQPNHHDTVYWILKRSAAGGGDRHPARWQSCNRAERS